MYECVQDPPDAFGARPRGLRHFPGRDPGGLGRAPRVPRLDRRSAQAVLDARASAGSPDAAPEQRFAVHGQATYVEQNVNNFRAPYRGPNSLTPDHGPQTSDLTLFVGARLWRGAELWISPEIDQGRGLDDTVGLAAFSSGEAYKVGSNAPYLRLPRFYVRQTIDAGGERENVEGVANQLAGSRGSTGGCSRWASSR